MEYPYWGQSLICMPLYQAILKQRNGEFKYVKDQIDLEHRTSYIEMMKVSRPLLRASASSKE